jgi:hypothetical protein
MKSRKRASGRPGPGSGLGIALALTMAAAPAGAAVVRTTQELLAAVATARPGDVIEIAPGTYLLDAPLQLTAAGPVVLRGGTRPTEVELKVRSGALAARVSGASWSLQRLTLRGGVRVESSGTGVALEGLRVQDAQVGIELGEATDLQCAISGARLVNNVVVMSGGGDGIRLNSVCSAQILHQTVWGTARPLLVQGPSLSPVLLNNLWSGQVTMRGRGDAVLAAPQSSEWFVAAFQGDFHLRAGAQVVDTGVTSAVADDTDGVKRPQGMAPDPGAYELVAGGPGPGDGGQDGGGTGGTIPVGPGGGGGRQKPPIEDGCAVSGLGSQTNGGGAQGAMALALIWAIGLVRRRRR